MSCSTYLASFIWRLSCHGAIGRTRTGRGSITTPHQTRWKCDRSDLAKSIQFQVDLAKSNIPEEAAYISTGGTLALYVANELSNKVARKIFALARTPGIPVEPVIAYG